MRIRQELDVNRTDGDIGNEGRTEALSFGTRPHESGPRGARPEAGLTLANEGHRQDASQKASDSLDQRPSAREKDMNVILESLNET